MIYGISVLMQTMRYGNYYFIVKWCNACGYV